MMSEIFAFNSWMWIGIAIFLAVAEIIAFGSLFLLVISLSALVVGVLQWLFPNLAWQYQGLLFCVLVITTNIFLWNYVKKRPATASGNTLNQKEKQFLGNIYSLQESIVNGHGKIKIGDTVWLVSGPDQVRGSRVKVISMKGTVLEVEALK